MSEVEECINVCYSPDDNYAVPCAVSAFSVLRKISSNKKVAVYILDGGLKDSSKTTINNIINLFSNAAVFYVPVKDEDFKDFYTEDWKTSAAYRLNIGSQLTNIDKVLYLDCDIIAQKSIEELYSTDLASNVIGMVPDIWFKTQTARFKNKKQPYCNTGVCLFDLKKWRDEDICRQLVQYHSKNIDHIKFPDQDPINDLLDSRIKILDYKYNWCWHWEKNEYFDEFGEVKEADAVLIHYIFSKPWKTRRPHIAADRYFDVLEQIPKEIRKDYANFGKNQWRRKIARVLKKAMGAL